MTDKMNFRRRINVLLIVTVLSISGKTEAGNIADKPEIVDGLSLTLTCNATVVSLPSDAKHINSMQLLRELHGSANGRQTLAFLSDGDVESHFLGHWSWDFDMNRSTDENNLGDTFIKARILSAGPEDAGVYFCVVNYTSDIGVANNTVTVQQNLTVAAESGNQTRLGNVADIQVITDGGTMTLTCNAAVANLSSVAQHVNSVELSRQLQGNSAGRQSLASLQVDLNSMIHVDDEAWEFEYERVIDENNVAESFVRARKLTSSHLDAGVYYCIVHYINSYSISDTVTIYQNLAAA